MARLRAPSGGGSAPVAEESPFVPISLPWRLLIVAYVVIYEILLWLLSIAFYGDPQPLSEARLLAHSAHRMMLLLPIIFYRKHYGWLHPLILPMVYHLATNAARDPQLLIEPLLLFQRPFYPELQHLALPNWPQHALAEAALKERLLDILALGAYYVGYFFSPRLPIPKLKFSSPRAVFTKSIGLVILSALILGGLLISQGGLVAHFNSFGQGRFNALAGSGHIVAQIQVGLIALMTWYSYRKRLIRRPIFLGLLLAMLVMLFITNGSRGTVIHGLLYFLLLWMLHHRRVPLFQGVALGLSALVLFGTLGLVRTSTFGAGGVDTSVITSFDLERSIDAARAEVEMRRMSSGRRVVVATVPQRADYLLGESYLGVIFFWLPRAIWEEKPRGAGAIYSERILGFKYGATSIPIGSVAEAYWNFSYPGVVVVYLLFGAFHKWLALMFLAYYRRLPGLWPFYILALTGLLPGSDNTVSTIQQLFLCLFVLIVFGVFFRRRKQLRRMPGSPQL